MLNSSPFYQHNGEHADDPAGQLPAKGKGVEKRMSEQAAERCGNAHQEKVVLEPDEHFPGLPRFLKLVEIKNTQRRHQQVGDCNYGLIYSKSKQMNGIHSLHISAILLT